MGWTCIFTFTRPPPSASGRSTSNRSCAGGSLHQRQIGLLHPPRGECRLEPSRVRRPAAAGDEAAGLAVQPVGRVGLLARRVAVTLLQRPGERAHVVARRGMDGEARRLLHHQERLVLVDDGERRRLAGVSRAPLAQGEAQPGPDARLGQELGLCVHQAAAAQEPQQPVRRKRTLELLRHVVGEGPARVVRLDLVMDQRVVAQVRMPPRSLYNSAGCGAGRACAR